MDRGDDELFEVDSKDDNVTAGDIEVSQGGPMSRSGDNLLTLSIVILASLKIYSVLTMQHGVVSDYCA